MSKGNPTRHTHTHTHTHTCLERRGGTIRASLNFLRISEVFVIHRVARSQDYRNQRICAISRSAANGKYRTEKKRDGTQTSVTPESRPFQGNSTRNFCWCTPVHVLNHTSEEITIFAPISFGQLNMRCCTILHGLTLFLRPRTSSLLTRTTVRRSKVLWMSSEVSLYKCTHTHTHTHTHMHVYIDWQRRDLQGTQDSLVGVFWGRASHGILSHLHPKHGTELVLPQRITILLQHLYEHKAIEAHVHMNIYCILPSKEIISEGVHRCLRIDRRDWPFSATYCDLL